MIKLTQRLCAGALATLVLAAPALSDGFALPGKKTFPEGITGTSDGTFFVGSLYEGEVFRRKAGEAEASSFISAGSNGLVSAVGMLADEKANQLWVCSSDPGAGKLTGKAKPALLAFDLDSGRPEGRYELPGGGFCNDITVDDKGAVYATNSLRPEILRLAPGEEALSVWSSDERFKVDGFGLNGIVHAGGGVFYAVTYANGRLFRLMQRASGLPTVDEIALDRPLEEADGLKLVAANRLVVVEGVGRLSQITLSGDEGKVAMIAEGFDNPTTFALDGKAAWLVEGQLGKLFSPDKNGPPALPFKVHRVALD